MLAQAESFLMSLPERGDRMAYGLKRLAGLGVLLGIDESTLLYKA